MTIKPTVATLDYMRKLPYYARNSGQALLLVLLSMAVVLTIVLSVLSRSITDVRVTTKEEEALRAFSAAEAGVEQSLLIGTSLGDTSLGDASFLTSVQGAFSTGQEFVNPIGIFSGESMMFWFVSHDEDTGQLTCSDGACFTGSQIKICWGKPGTPSDSETTPAIEIGVFYTTTPGSYSTAKIARQTFDPNTARRSSNNFSAPDNGTCALSGDTFQFQKTINFASMGIPAGTYQTANGLQFAKVRMFYNSAETHQIGISASFAGNSNLPSQGIKIVSTGVSGDANRKIEVFQGYGEPPSIFDTAMFSTGGITK